MPTLLLLNACLIALGSLLPTTVLANWSFLLYAAQFLTLVPVAARRAYFASNLFLPSLFALAYYLVSLTLGAYLVPRGFGFYKGYTDITATLTTYHISVPYLLLSNLALFVISVSSLTEMATIAKSAVSKKGDARVLGSFDSLILQLFCGGVFAATIFLNIYSDFSLQLACIVVHSSELTRRRAPYRGLVYLGYLVGEVGFNFNNKREVVMILFVMAFMELWLRRTVLRMTIRHLVAYAAAAASFLSLIFTASILRGYGSFQVSSWLDAMLLIPSYIRSPVFWDAIVDNFELNYSYGAAVTSIDYVLSGKLQYQVGLSLWKVFFLPVPRDLVVWKPESVMQLYTKAYNPAFWNDNGSLPVIFSSEMFVNFGFLGILPFVLMWLLLNKVFISVVRENTQSFFFYTGAFFCLSVLAFARGSGLDLYVLTYLVGVPILLLAALLQLALRLGSVGVGSLLRRQSKPSPSQHA